MEKLNENDLRVLWKDAKHPIYINSNTELSLQDVKTLLNYLPVIDGKFIFPSNIFTGFGNMLESIANPLQNSSEEARSYIMQKVKELNLTGGKIIRVD